VKKIADKATTCIDITRGGPRGSLGGSAGSSFKMSQKVTEQNMKMMLGGGGNKRALSPQPPGAADDGGGLAKRMRLSGPAGSASASTTSLTSLMSSSPLGSPSSAPAQPTKTVEVLIGEVMSDFGMRPEYSMGEWERECLLFLKELKVSRRASEASAKKS
jgi:hypothetical protein